MNDKELLNSTIKYLEEINDFLHNAYVYGMSNGKTDFDITWSCGYLMDKNLRLLKDLNDKKTEQELKNDNK